MNHNKALSHLNVEHTANSEGASLDASEYQEISAEIKRIGDKLDSLLTEVTEFLNNN